MIQRMLASILVFLLLLIPKSIASQNLLDTSSWTVGSGSVAGFIQNGNTTENFREVGLDHLGNQKILWKAVHDANANSNADGGWNTSPIAIDNTMTYRFSVWIKKTNSNNGITYFGCQRFNYPTNSNENILNLNNSININPYFWNGDLPLLDRWYLLVGYVHNSTYSGTTNIGGVYDGVTGQLAFTISDFKSDANTSIIRHRAYLYYDTNVNDNQYFFDPRLESVNGNEPSISELLQIAPNSQLVFSYDASGNQKQRFYCQVMGCTPPDPPLGRTSNEVEVSSIDKDEIDIVLSPNPTKDFVNLKLGSDHIGHIESINVYDVNSSLVQQVKINDKDVRHVINLEGRPSGIYFVHIHFSDESKSVTKKIIKK